MLIFGLKLTCLNPAVKPKFIVLPSKVTLSKIPTKTQGKFLPGLTGEECDALSVNFHVHRVFMVQFPVYIPGRTLAAVWVLVMYTPGCKPELSDSVHVH